MNEYRVQVIMTIKADSPEDAVEGAGRWLPAPGELPLSCSDGVEFTTSLTIGQPKVWVVVAEYPNSFNESFDDEREVGGVFLTKEQAEAFAHGLETRLTCIHCKQEITREDFRVVCPDGPVGWHNGKEFPSRHYAQPARSTTVTEWEVQP